MRLKFGIPFLLVLPALFFISVFLFGSLAVTIANSLQAPGKYFTLDNYSEFFLDPSYYSVIFTTLRITAESTCISVFFGYVLASTIVNVKSPRLKRLFLLILFSSLLISFMSRMYGWIAILGFNGTINRFLLYLGFPRADLIYNELAVVIGLTHWLTPFAVLSIFYSIQNIDPNVEDSARCLGASEVRTFIKVTLPLSMPGIIAAGAICTSLALGAYVAPLILGGGLIYMMSTLVYGYIIQVFDLGLGSAIACIFLAMSLTLIYIYDKVLTRYGGYHF